MHDRKQEHRRRWRLGASLLLVALPLAGCGDSTAFLQRFLLKTDDIIIERQPDRAYEQLFARYVEVCALSQWSRVDGTRRGNPFGHAVMYLKGACKDDTAPFPQLRRCEGENADLDSPEHGAGVSVGQWFRNVNWIAIPGHRLFYDGHVAHGQRLTREHLDATVADAIARGVFTGVELHDGWIVDDDRSLTRYVTDVSVATDFALRFSRNVFCARIPVTAAMLDEIIAFLNDKNTEYATGEADYQWNLISNNCVHTLRNALAAVNVVAPMSVRQIKLRHLVNLAVPANEFVNLAVLGATPAVDDYAAIHGIDPQRDALHEFHWLPSRHGALLKTLPVHEPNDIYTTDFQLFVVQSPISLATTQKAVRLMADPRYADLKTNLLFYRDAYATALARHEYTVDPLASVRGSRFRRMARLHHDYLVAQHRDVEDKLRLLSALDPAEGIGDRAPAP